MTGRRVGASRPHDEFVDQTMPHFDAVWNVARRMTPDPCAAEDLVQETYLRAFRGFAHKRDGDTRAWLVSICLNTARSEFRRRSRRPLEDLAAEVELPAMGDGADGAALAVLDREALSRALDALPDPQRVVVVLADLAGLTANEIAGILDAPRGTILARIHRGRRRLAIALANEGVRDAV